MDVDGLGSLCYAANGNGRRQWSCQFSEPAISSWQGHLTCPFRRWYVRVRVRPSSICRPNKPQSKAKTGECDDWMRLRAGGGEPGHGHHACICIASSPVHRICPFLILLCFLYCLLLWGFPAGIFCDQGGR